jgi:methylmalonyl-CoA mutase
LFQQIEKEGGLHTVLASGSFAARVAETRAKRRERVARRLDPLTGASEFPPIADVAVHVLKPLELTLQTDETKKVAPVRLSEPFEQLRAATDRMALTTGTRPAVFLANLGPLAAFSARAMFAKNFFAAAGVAALDNDGFDAPEDIAAAFQASGANLACLCSTDEIYAQKAPGVARALSTAGARAIYLAGRPGADADAMRAAGVSAFIYAGCDALAVPAEAQERIQA